MATFDTNGLLGAIGGDPKNFTVYVFVPSLTRDGEPIDHEAWRGKALHEMASIFGGATAMEGSGAWRDDDRGGEVKVERISTVSSLMAESDWNEEKVSRLARFLHQMGREANQGEIGLVVDGQYFPIREFDK